MITISREVSLATAAAEVERSMAVQTVLYQSEIQDRLEGQKSFMNRTENEILELREKLTFYLFLQ